ncbi:hypothetical protein K505DRAFT_340472 [Melanomma pulvis-pyrius CBS 109.77]|uniref:Protein kinase domain-containing protein n=1 Tax=Melanomma pulvis-pyrius CBS 109.77 TaxID=1314802 RepID=A0A6A6X2M1_9PLEO|nr:hypothetical protein K505DRAFT_340472 [Melanomma pulvis-pyrius CBS 109.77]
MQLSEACVLPKSSRSIPNDVEHDDHPSTTYQAIASAAEISLEVQAISTTACATLKINEGDISHDSDTSRLGTYTPPNGKELRVFVENTVGCFYEKSTGMSLWEQSVDRISTLAKVLGGPKAVGFRTLRCVGYVAKHFNELELVYELPPGADPLTHPVTLHDLLTEPIYQSDEPSSLDDRFELASSLARGLFEIHSTGWLHRNFSTKSVLFFRSNKEQEQDTIDDFDLHTPYISGFEFARSMGAYNSMRSYLFYKEFTWFEYGSSPDDVNTLFYQPRHDYYSLGLVLLEIGIWKSLPECFLGDNLSTKYPWTEDGDEAP